MSSLKSIADRLLAVLNDAEDVVGAVVGVAVGDEQTAIAHGIANLNTGQPFTEDTGWLLGSVTKVLTATVLMRLVERGEVDLDHPVKRYVPDFPLRDADAAERITVRMLVNHTNGIDAESLLPVAVRGRDATRSYIEALPRIGVVFEPGAGLHYSNPGFVVAARVIEARTGMPFERAIERELFGPAGMNDATLVQTQAFLRRTAVGAFPGPDGTGVRATSLFTLPESGAGAGTTPIVTVADMLAFGRTHLREGVAPNGTRVLSAEVVEQMRTATYDLGIPQAPPIGLGWWLCPIAETVAPWHGGGSPGGSSSFCVLPEFDATIVSFATGPTAGTLHDRLHSAVIEELSGKKVAAPLDISPTPVDASIAGEYASFESRVILAPKDDNLVVTRRYEPFDEDHRRTIVGYIGDERYLNTSTTYLGVAPGQYAPEGAADAASLSGFLGRMRLIADLPAAPGRRPGLHSAFRYTPKIG
jgi:CubicO group peptidase (beta-lactamase class C family)